MIPGSPALRHLLGSLAFTILVFSFCTSCVSSDFIKPVQPDMITAPGPVWPKGSYNPLVRFHSVIRHDKDVVLLMMDDQVLGPQPDIVLKRPVDIAVADDNTIFVSDTALRNVFIIRRAAGEEQPGRFTPLSDGLVTPHGLAFSNDLGLLAVTDLTLKQVHIFNVPEMELVMKIGDSSLLSLPTDVAMDPRRGLLYVTDAGLNHILVFFLKDGSYSHSIGKMGRREGMFFQPMSLDIDPEGNLYVVDSRNFRVQVISPGGEIRDQIGSHGEDTGEFSKPYGIAIDATGRIVVTDVTLNRVQIFTALGTPVIHFGRKGLRLGQFDKPTGVAAGRDGRLYVVDQQNSRIQIFESPPKTTDRP